MSGSYALPNPNSPATSDPLVSLPVRQNFQSLQSQINNADGAALQALSVPEAALSLNANPRLRATNAGTTYVVSGLNPAIPGSGLVVTIPAGIAYVNGYYVAYAGGTITVAANKDTYLDLDQNGGITQVAVANNATSGMTLTTNCLRFAKVVANANIVQVLQNTPNYAPVAPSTLNWSGADPLGTIVYPTGAVSARGLVNPYKFNVWQSGDFSATSSTWQKQILNTKVFDTGNNFDATTNYRFVIPVTGFYYICGQVGLTVSGAGAGVSMADAIYKNGVTLISSGNYSASGTTSSTPRPNIGGIFPFVAGDYLELYGIIGEAARQFQGGQNNTFMSGFLVSVN